MVQYDNWPCLSWVLNQPNEADTFLENVAHYVVMIFLFIIALIVDLARLVLFAIGKFIWNTLVVDFLVKTVIVGLYETFVKSFLGKLLSGAAFIIIGFLIYWIIETKAWVSVCTYLSQFFSLFGL